MYESYFGLIERPFSIAPDPQYLYMSARHKEAMAHLSYGLSQGGCFIVLTGEVGTGKTTLCRNLMTDLPDNVDLALILNANINETELLQTICDELKILYLYNSTQKQLLDLINQHLLSTFANNRHTVLIIDEAQLLSRDVLEQVRLLTNLETTKHKLLQIILIGQPELNDMLTRNDLRQLAQRVTARYHLGELKRSEIEEYVNYRLSVAGCKQPLFSSQALAKLHQATDGIPRKINVLADHALLSAYAQKQRLVDANNIKESAKEVFFASKAAPVISSPVKKWGLLVLGLVLLNALFWWYFMVAKKDDPAVSIQEAVPSAVVPKIVEQDQYPLNTEPLIGVPETDVDSAMQVELLDIQPEDPIEIGEAADSEEGPDGVIADVTEFANEAVNNGSVNSVSEMTGSGWVITSDEYLDVDDGVVEAYRGADDLVPVKQVVSAEDIAKRAILEQTEFGRILETSADLTGRVTAFKELTRLWGVELPNQLFSTICEEVQTSGLRCSFFAGWDQLLRFNRPAILVLRHNNQLHRVIVEIVDGDAAEVQIGGSIYRISVEELQSRWEGNDAVLVWRPSDAGSQFLQEGDTAPLLPVMRSYINDVLVNVELPELESLDSVVFDHDLSQKLIVLQRAFNLIADAKIGNETYLLINESMRPDTTPVLRNRLNQSQVLQ